MKQRFTLNLSYLIEDIFTAAIDSGELDISGSGIFANLEDKLIFFTWADFRDIADSPDINNSLKKQIRELLKEYDEDEQ